MRAMGQVFALYMSQPMVLIMESFMAQDPTHADARQLAHDFCQSLGPLTGGPFVNMIQFFALIFAYCWDQLDAAYEMLPYARSMMRDPPGLPDAILGVWMECLVLLALVQSGKDNHYFVRWQRLWIVRRRVRMLKQWALWSPATVLGKLFFIEAELAVALGNHSKAMSKYYSAKLHSREAGFLLQEAMMMERLGRYHLRRDEFGEGRSALEEAVELYDRWGAQQKVEDLTRLLSETSVVKM